MSERRYWNEKMETKSFEEMRDIQLEKLKKQIYYIYNSSPLYYKKKFDDAGVKPGDVKTWDDFYNLPIMGNKEMEIKSQEESLARGDGHPFGTFLCAPVEKVVGITATGGTTGDPTFSYIYTEKDLRINDEVWARVFWTAGIRPGNFVVNIFAQSMHAGGWPVNHALTSFGACPVPVGAEAGTERILRMLNLFRPAAIVGTAPLMEHLIERCPDVLKKGIGELGIKILLCAGAPGAGIPSIRKKLEDAYGAKIFDSAGGGQGAHMVSCDSKEYYGMHINCADYFIWPGDLIDPETDKAIKIADGVIGHAIFTALEQEAKPFFRYAWGDLLQVFTKECPGCGFRGLRIRIVGRADEMLIVKGINVYPTAVKGVVNTFLPRVTGEMRIILDEPGPDVKPPLKLEIEHAGLDESELHALKEEIIHEIKNKLEVRPNVKLVAAGTFERAGGVSAKGTLIEKRYKKS
ncbi:MAG: hypothetical protein Q7J31_10425 [Syntrophales bacterium]|nr:hypothetical protein [Syntrophales bacterium]